MARTRSTACPSGAPRRGSSASSGRSCVAASTRSRTAARRDAVRRRADRAGTRRGTGTRLPASTPRPDGALVASHRDLRVPPWRPRPRRPGVPPGSHWEVAPCASRSCPWPWSPSVAAACGSSSSSTGYVRAARPTTPQPAAGATPRGDTLRRGHLRGPRSQPHHRHRRGPRLDLRHGRRHRLVHHRPALRRRRQSARSRERPRRGVGQRLRSGLSATDRCHVRRPRRRSPGARRRRRRPPAPDRDPGPRVVGAAAAGCRADVRHRHLGFDGARGSPRARQGFAAQARRGARARRFDRRRRLRR